MFCYPKRIFHFAGSLAVGPSLGQALFASVFRAGQSRIRPSSVRHRSRPKPSDKARTKSRKRSREARKKTQARTAATKSNAIYFLVTVKLIATAMLGSDVFCASIASSPGPILWAVSRPAPAPSPLLVSCSMLQLEMEEKLQQSRILPSKAKNVKRFETASVRLSFLEFYMKRYQFCFVFL